MRDVHAIRAWRAPRSPGGIRRLVQRMLVLQEDERREVARELHEEAGQLLTTLLFGIKVLDGAQTLEQVKAHLPTLKEQTLDALETMRQVSVALRPPLLEDLGLLPTLRSFLRDFGARHQIQVVFAASGDEFRLDPIHEVTVFRIVQEALTNAGKYAQASLIKLAIHYQPTLLHVSIVDDGVGFDLPAQASPASIGIAGMKLRADLLGGVCTVESLAGAGVTVNLRIPLPIANVTEMEHPPA